MMKLADRTTVPGAGLRGFVPFIALFLWFLLAILGSARAAPGDAALTATDLLPEIEAQLIEAGMPADAEITLAHPDQTAPAAAQIARASYHPLSGRFIIRFDDGATSIAGVARRVLSVPVPVRTINRGETIATADVSYADVEGAPGRGFVEDAAGLVGMTARRPLAAGAPVRESDVAAPVLVEKGAIVTLAYEIAGLRMTHQGVAMENGAEGEVVPVRNIDSDRTLKGVVKGRNFVSIAPRRRSFEG